MIRRPSTSSSARTILSVGVAGLLAPLALPAQSAPGFVYETTTEFHTVADVDGDGRPDIVVVDKESGEFRIAAPSSDGGLVWRTNPGHSGLRPVTGFSAGRLLQDDRDVLLFAEAFSNRIQLVDTPTDSRLTEPLLVVTNYVGPALVTAINLPSSNPDYNQDYLDIVYHPTLQSGAYPNVIAQLRNSAGKLPFDDLSAIGASGTPYRANRILVENGGEKLYGVMEDYETESILTLYKPSSPPDLIATADGLPTGAAYVYADFNGDGLAQFIFFTPGSTTLYESNWDGSELTQPNDFNYPEEITDIRVIETSGAPELLIIHSKGTVADRVAYQSGGNLSVEETFDSFNGGFVTGAVGIDDLLHLFIGDSSGVSKESITYKFDGSNHTAIDHQKLTPLRGGVASGSSVLLFDSPPLTNPDARLLSHYDAGAWTSVFTLNGGKAEVVSERFRSASEGLGDQQTITIDSTPSITAGGLTNQVGDDLSLRFQESPVGKVTSQVQIEPRSGAFRYAVRPEITATGDVSNVFYRRAQDVDWTNYASNPPVITTNTVLYAIATTDDGFSNIARVEYTFTQNPGIQDSNGNGLPDFVALAYGLDPLAGSFDSDGDGFTDFEEILAGTDPNDPNSKPDRADTTFEYPNTFNLTAAPAIPNPGAGSGHLRSFAADDPDDNTIRRTRMNVHQPNGFALGNTRTASTPLLPYPAATFQALAISNSDLFVVVSTETNFPVDDGSSKDYGRQVAAAVNIPKQAFEPFVYEDFGAHGGYDDLAAEAAAWRAAALAYYDSLERPSVTLDAVGPESTLGLLLIERILGNLLYERDLIDRTNITLTPFRSNETPLAPGAEDEGSTRNRSLSLNDLLALQRDAGEEASSYRIHSVVKTVNDAVDSAPTANIEQLIELTNRLYTTSATNQTAGSLRPPLEALRRFIRTGTLENTGYDTGSTAAQFPASLLADAAAGVAEIEDLIEERTRETIYIYYSGASQSAGCPVWQEVVFNQGTFNPNNPILLGEYALIDDQGRPFPVARAFPLTSGSVFRVTGFLEPADACGNPAIEVIPQPSLVFLHNAPPQDSDGNLIPDSIQNLFPNVTLSPFADSDGNGYSDLQEILSGSDPTDPKSIPMVNGQPAPVYDLSPPPVAIVSSGNGSSEISFHFPADFAKHIQFQLYSSDDLQEFAPTGLRATQIGNGSRHELTIPQSGDAEFYIFRMSLK